MGMGEELRSHEHGEKTKGRRASRVLMGCVVLLWVGCAENPSKPPAASSAVLPASLAEPAFTPVGPEFSARAAAGHVRALAGLPDRSPESDGDARARSYLKDAFVAAGATVDVFEDGQRRHLVATLAGQSEDSILLIAAYPSLVESDWVDGSGAGLLLELARVSSLEERSYTLRFALADTQAGNSPDAVSSEPPREMATLAEAAGAGAPDSWAGSLGEARYWLEEAGNSLANAFALRPHLGSLRAVIALDAPARPDLRLARDLRSHPVYRGLFWTSAASLGRSDLFPDDGGWASPLSLHSGFRQAAEGRVLALVDEQVARADLYSAPISGEPSEETLGGLGGVTVRALDGLMDRLAKIDSFGR